MKNVYYVGSGELTFDLIERIINENLKLELAPEAKERIQKCRDYLDKKTAESAEPLYGITTGFGSLCSKSISPDELGTLQENLIKSHACSVGEEIRPVIIKLMMLLKAHALSLGHSGVQVITVQRILDFFNNDVMPIVYDRGSLGASGDLAPLANLFLPLIGVGDVYYKGRKREAISVLDEFGWEPVKLMSKEGLALLNGTQFMSANGVFAILKAFRLSKKADLIAALSLEAFDGRIDPFMDCIQQIRPHKGQIETGENFRKLSWAAVGYLVRFLRDRPCRTGKHLRTPYRPAHHGTAGTAGVSGCQSRPELRVYDSSICRRLYGEPEQDVLLCCQQRLYRVQQRTGGPCQYGSQRSHEALPHHGQLGTHPCHRTDECCTGH